jgi:hypothetical protein
MVVFGTSMPSFYSEENITCAVQEEFITDLTTFFMVVCFDLSKNLNLNLLFPERRKRATSKRPFNFLIQEK